MTRRLQRKFVPWILHHSFEFKWHYLGAFACLTILQLLQAEIPFRIRRLTELMGAGRLGEASVWIFVGLALGILIFRTFSRLLFFYPVRVQQKYLRMELLEELEKVPSTRYGNRSQGQIFQILFDDINNLRAFVGFGMLQICNIIIAAWVLIPRVSLTDAYLWPAFSPLFFSVFLFSVMTMINQRFFKRMLDKKGEVQQYIIEAYEAKQSIKNFHREDNFIKGFLKVSGEELSLFFKSSVLFAVVNPYVKLGLGASLLWASLLIKARGGGAGDLVFFSGFLYLFLEPVQFMSWVAVVVSQGLAAWRRVKELHGSIIEPTADEDFLRKATFLSAAGSQEVQLELWQRPVTVRARIGHWTVVTGETGSGKSYLLSRLATVMILNDKKVSMVQQEPYLFNDTIRENIFLGQHPDEEQLRQAKELLEIFQLDSLEPSLDQVLDLEVGENGKRLSGGQMKRVALIRSLLSGVDVLVWDDPFSSVDIILERKIINRLKSSKEWGGKTFILSSHRLTTVRLSDDIIFLEREKGIGSEGPVQSILKDSQVAKFFKEQMVELPLA